MSAISLSACGGGGDGGGAGNDAAPASAPSSTSQLQVPKLETPAIDLQKTGSIGAKFWTDGSSSIGGHGSPIDGVFCLVNENYHIHAHLAIIKDGVPLAIPKDIGLAGCAYELHTHDESGVIHVETSQEKMFTLGQFFGVWGRYLTATNTAGIMNYPTRVFVEDGGAVSEIKSDPSNIVLTSHRSITIVLGVVAPTIPTYKWPDSL